MNETKYIMIAEQLEADIRSGELEKKLPSVRTLSARFKVSTRTMNKAIKTLSTKGLVIPSGSSGVLINKNRHVRSRTGNVVIFCNRDNADVNNDELLHELSDIILSSGMRPVFMKAPHPEIFKDENFWKSGWVDGYIFVYSSFDRSFAHQLTRINVPFVTANIVPDEYGVNWIDFDNDETDRILFHKIAKCGYRRICYCANLNHPEAHQKSVLKNINPIKWKFMLDIDFCFLQNRDKELINAPEAIRRHARQTVKHMLKQPNKSEVVLTLLPPAVLKEEMDAAGLNDVPIVAAGLTPHEYVSQGKFPCVVHSYSKLAQETFHLFEKVLNNPQASPEHILIPCEYHLDKLKAKSSRIPREMAVC